MKNYVKKYKGYDVPEGAVYYVPKTAEHNEAFCDEDKRVLVSKYRGEWVEINGQVYAGSRSLIELPLEEEWVPVVGRWCEYQFAGEWYSGRFHGACDRLGYFVLYDAGGYIEIKTTAFRPPKSEREEFIERSIELTELDGSLPVEAFGIQYDNGARFVEAEDE